MAVLKYKSGGKVKTLGVVKSGVSGVSSVNGKTGVVTGVYDTDNQPPYPVRSVNGKTGVVTGLYDAENQPPYPVKSVNGKTGIVTGLYDEENQPPYPVKSVNGKKGIVTGLYDAENQPPYPVTSVNGKTGDVTGLYDANNPPPQTVKSAVVTLQKDEFYGGYFFPTGFPQNKVSKFIKADFETLPSETTNRYNIFIFHTTEQGNGVRVVIAGLSLDVSNKYYLSLWESAPSISVRVYYEE